MRQFKITKQISNCEADSLSKYFKEINRERLITASEEAELARKIKLGDEWAKERLIKANLRFVVSVAKQYQHSGLPLTDLINEGNIGLIKAVKRFDGSRGFKLITYAVWWIRRSIRLAIDEQSRLVRLPYNQSNMIYKVTKTFSKMEQQLQREPSYEEVGNEICLSAEVVENIMRSSTKEVSIEAPLAGTENFSLGDMIEDTEKNAEQQFTSNSLKHDMERAISKLSSREASVLKLYFGLDDSPPLTYEEIGEQIGVVRERVRQIKEKALINLRQIARLSLKEYMG